MPTNDFIGFASSGSANIMSQADFAAAAEQIDGVQPGPASSKLANKIWRQGANMAAALGAFITAHGYDALDDGDIAALQNNFSSAICETGTWTPVIYGTTTAGTYTSSNVHGFYTKLGRLVFVNASIDVTWLTQPAGNARISGFPFTFRETNFGLYYDGSGSMAGATRIKCVVGIKNNNIAYIFAMNKDNSTNGQASFATTESGTSMVASVNSTLFSTLSGCYITD